MVYQHLPLHPLIMQDVERRSRIAARIKSLEQDDIEDLGNWSDLEILGQGARLESIDLDDEEIFEPEQGRFECLATFYVTLLWPEEIEFHETFGATFRGTINGQVAVDEVKIDSSSFTGNEDKSQERQL